MGKPCFCAPRVGGGKTGLRIWEKHSGNIRKTLRKELSVFLRIYSGLD